VRTITIERLTLLANFLDTVPKHRFDYETWVGHNWQGKPDLSCGTTGCAIGWAMTMPEFTKLGYGLVARKSFYRSDGFDVLFKMPGTVSLESAWYAGQQLFELNVDEFNYLFTPGSPSDRRWSESLSSYSPGMTASAQDVANHIRKFVAYLKGEAP
jgi:hypothetical protein